MFVEDPSIINEPTLDEKVAHILRVTNIKGFKLPDGGEGFGYRMPDETYMVIRPTEGMQTTADHSGWVASRVDENGHGLHCTTPMSLHEALVQSFKTPSPFYDLEGERKVAVAEFDGEDLTADAALAEVHRAEAERIVGAISPAAY